MFSQRPGVSFLALVCMAVEAAAAAPPAAQCVPPDAVAAVAIGRPAPILDALSSQQAIAMLTALPVYKTAAEGPKLNELRAGVAYLELRLGVKWPEALHKLLDGGALLSVHPRQGALVIVDAKDARLLGQLHETIVGIAKNEAEKAKQPERVHAEEYQGTKVWSFGKDEAHAIVGNRLLLSNQATLLKAALDCQAKGGASLASSAGFQAARKAAGADAVAMAYVDMKTLRRAPEVQKALKSREQPLAALLLAGVTEQLGAAEWLAVSLGTQGDTWRLVATVDSKPAAGSDASFALPATSDGAMPLPAVPDLIGGMSLYRDLHAFYAAKDKLFPERTSGLIFFENMMGIFFSGRDLTDEVLAQTRPDVRLVVARQEYDAAIGTPAIQLPAFGAIFHVKDAQKAGELAEEAWQKALGLVNFTRGQKAQAGLILDRDIHGGVKYSVARFSAADIKDKSHLDIRFNFRPALALVGEYLVVTSTDGLAKNLIDALQQETKDAVKALAQTHSMLELSGASLATILRANRETLVKNDMVEKGKPRQRAEDEFDTLTTLLSAVSRIRLNLGAAHGRPTATMELQVVRP